MLETKEDISGILSYRNHKCCVLREKQCVPNLFLYPHYQTSYAAGYRRYQSPPEFHSENASVLAAMPEITLLVVKCLIDIKDWMFRYGFQMCCRLSYQGYTMLHDHAHQPWTLAKIKMKSISERGLIFSVGVFPMGNII